MRHLDEASAGEAIVLALDQVVEICLPENRLTGFRWRFDWEGEPLGTPIADESTSADGPPGGGGQHCWRFRITRPGAAQLTYHLGRSWEPAPVQTLTYQFQVPVAEGASSQERC
jgi:predicted secreted protein